MLFDKSKLRLPDSEDALEGRKAPLPVTNRHFVTGREILPPFPAGLERAVFGMGCFWGAEKAFWTLPGVYTTAVGYAGGLTPNPTYKELCTGRTGHAEVVLAVFDPAQVPFDQLLKVFFEKHDPTQGMRQGNDVGTQYRSAVYTHSGDQERAAVEIRDAYQEVLFARGYDPITTEIRPAGPFYYAEDEHQQYLAKNPGGYCGLGGIGIACPVGLGTGG
ncbi:MAG: peptide-methionine (S)-S-oxide reductase MsrA [Thermoanaerobaculia bacterium]|nr:peptide-methionine (S)-S-oxide reductase MsrA [Thermoanaerobaculia bacterium]